MAVTRILPTGLDAEIVCVESAPFAENTWCLFGASPGRCIVVDPGFEPDAVIDALESRGLEPEAILLTHGHSDHIAGNAAMRERWPGVPIVIGEGDAEKLTDPQKNLSAPFGIALVSPPADRTVGEGGVVEAAGFMLDVREIPGHSIGHVVYVLRCSPPVVLGGDVLFRGSIGRTDFPDGDFETLARGIREKLYRLPDEAIVLPGHGPATTVGHEKRTNPFVAGV